METINQQLEALYKGMFGEGIATFGDDELSSPMTIKFADAHAVKVADLRVMFFGQETREADIDTVDNCMDSYCKFYNDFNKYDPLPDFVRYCWHLEKSRSAYWRVLEQMKDGINERLPDKRISYIWNNIVKADYDGGRVPKDVYAKFRDVNRKLILGEIEIIKPDVLVFFTGPKYDGKIDDVFNNGIGFNKPDIDIDGNTKILVLAPLPKYGDAYVSYHPRKLEQMPKAKDFVLGAIAEQCAAVLSKE